MSNIDMNVDNETPVSANQQIHAEFVEIVLTPTNTFNFLAYKFRSPHG